MNTDTTYSSTFGNSVADAMPAERASFIRKTYAHVALALLVFAGLVSILVNTETARDLAITMTGGWNWLIVLAAFMGVSWLAQSWASSTTSKPMQYMGLMLYTVAQSIIFLPLLFFAS